MPLREEDNRSVHKKIACSFWDCRLFSDRGIRLWQEFSWICAAARTRAFVAITWDVFLRETNDWNGRSALKTDPGFGVAPGSCFKKDAYDSHTAGRR
jgi:hypothetical protein